ncbi:MAG: carbamoyltransferase HypF [Deltaproteobacteria bacterium]|nr:carbamoyltransferase HypF [Deltaproteobacteria bacterium]
MRIELRLRGAVQGVGFRPFIYRTARRLGLCGYVVNEPSGVTIEAEGTREKIDRFLKIIESDSPPLAKILHRTTAFIPPAGYNDFEIRRSEEGGDRKAVLIPDLSTCRVCTEELLDPGNRRYRYPFINCTDCGPRFSIIEGLPYDRSRTTMKRFTLCPDCRREYEDPGNRRFHAEPNACPVCGPRVRLIDPAGKEIADGGKAIDRLLAEIRRGRIAAIKGVGGFHLVCNTTCEASVFLLRKRKGRSNKPFAVMFKDLDQVRRYADPTEEEETLLSSPERPVVLIRKREGQLTAVSPGLATVGAFLPYSPLHTVLLSALPFPIVATSGNFSEEPIVKGNEEAERRLSPLADFLLLHNRPIRRRCDDSVTRIIGKKPRLLRRARGFTATPMILPAKRKEKILAVGGQLKNTFALAFDDQVIVSPHIGDLETPEGMDHFESALSDLCRIYDFTPDRIVHDLHPGYATTRWARGRADIETTPIQHHYAHILSCMAEHGLTDTVTGIAWDGTGYGPDGTVWGGEVLRCTPTEYERLFHFRPFPLLGGDKAVFEPRRVALALLMEIYGERAFAMDLPPIRAFRQAELHFLEKAWEKRINAPLTSSVGRLFDGVASLLGIVQILNYEAEGAMKIEDRVLPGIDGHYRYNFEEGIIDWRPLIEELIHDREQEKVPARFVNTLARIIIDCAHRAGRKRICLSGGVFQNRPLTERAERLLRKDGFSVFTQSRIPCNDGGLSLGQAYWRTP